MSRRTMRLAWIPNEAARRSAMRKRRQSLVRKVKELSILCGVPAFCIIYYPGEPEPTVWPPNREEAKKLAARFLALPAVERSKRATNQETYLRDQLTKLHDAQMQQQKVLNELELAYLMDQVHYSSTGLDLQGLNRLSFLLGEKLREIKKKAEYFEVELNGSSEEDYFMKDVLDQYGDDGNGN